MNSLTARVEDLWDENRALKERVGDFNRVERALGSDMIEDLIQRDKMMEQAEKDQKRAKRRKIDRGAR